MYNKKAIFISVGAVSVLGLSYLLWYLINKKNKENSDSETVLDSNILKANESVIENKIDVKSIVNEIVNSLDSLYRKTLPQNPDKYSVEIRKLVDELSTYGYAYVPPTEYGKSKLIKI